MRKLATPLALLVATAASHAAADPQLPPGPAASVSPALAPKLAPTPWYGITALGVPPGHSDAYALAINDAGESVGYAVKKTANGTTSMDSARLPADRLKMTATPPIPPPTPTLMPAPRPGVSR